jgi:hypothetical protein
MTVGWNLPERALIAWQVCTQRSPAHNAKQPGARALAIAGRHVEKVSKSSRREEEKRRLLSNDL